MPRQNRPILDAAAGNLLRLLALYRDKPCPANAEIREWTMVPRRRVPQWLAGLAARGAIEIETRGKPPLRRRMRASGMPWTGWTQRGKSRSRPKK